MKRNKPLWVSLMLMVIIAAVVGCGSAKAAPDAQLPEKNTVLIQDYNFQPAEITILKGETIIWINLDSMSHTATGKYFDSGLLGKGQSYKQTFAETGVFDYICTPHPFMMGKIIVK